jgi:hypothetical protein
MPSLAQQFNAFAERECAEAPRYAHLAQHLAADDELLALLAPAPPNWQLPRQTLAAVHALLLEENTGPLAAYYPTLTPHAQRPDPDFYPHFRAFCLAHRRALLQLLTDEVLQPNEVGRIAPLALGFWHAARRHRAGRPWAWIEIGASAGFHLLWDQVALDFGDGRERGRTDASARIACEARGLDPLLVQPSALPPVSLRLGIDRAPQDLRAPTAYRWQKALLFPEATAEHARFEQMVALTRQRPPRLIADNVVRALPHALNELPREMPLVFFHSFTLHLLPGEACGWIADLLLAQAHLRDVFWIALEPFSAQMDTLLECLAIVNGQPTHTLLAQAHPRGEWVAPLAHPPALTALRFAFQQQAQRTA